MHNPFILPVYSANIIISQEYCSVKSIINGSISLFLWVFQNKIFICFTLSSSVYRFPPNDTIHSPASPCGIQHRITRFLQSADILSQRSVFVRKKSCRLRTLLQIPAYTHPSVPAQTPAASSPVVPALLPAVRHNRPQPSLVHAKNFVPAYAAALFPSTARDLRHWSRQSFLPAFAASVQRTHNLFPW